MASFTKKENAMYVYIKSEHCLWTVGFYDPSGKWHPESDHESPDAAAARVAYLNGNSQKRTRAPGAGRKRDDTLPDGPVVKMQPIWINLETANFLRSLKSASAFVRAAIAEKRQRENQ